MSIIGRLLGFMTNARTYATWNPSDKGSSITLSNGNLTASNSATSAVRSTIGKSSGKWYWEYTISTGTTGDSVGIANASASLSLRLGSDASGWGYAANGNSRSNGVAVAYGSLYTTTYTIGIALDMDAGTITCYNSGVSQGVMFSALTGTIYAAIGSSGTTAVLTANFGASAFVNSPPVGFNSGLYS